MAAKLGIALVGAGRIGAVHGENTARHPGAELLWVVDPNEDAARRLADRCGAKTAVDVDPVLRDPAVGAVIVASSTSAHVSTVEAAAGAGKAVFCEKPIDLDLSRARQAVAAVERSGVPFFVGFNRRFDPSFARLEAQLRMGAIGELETVHITSRDPSPPPASYIRESGGIFRDMTIHDFDMARWLLGSEPAEVFATGSVLVDPTIEGLDDLDTVLVVLRSSDKKLCQIANSRRAAYGYDQRIEVFGSEGMLQADNTQRTTVSVWTERGMRRDLPPHFFIDRYREAYRAELDHFVDVLAAGGRPSVGTVDGLQALVLAEAASASVKKGGPVLVPTP